MMKYLDKNRDFHDDLYELIEDDLRNELLGLKSVEDPHRGSKLFAIKYLYCDILIFDPNSKIGKNRLFTKLGMKKSVTGSALIIHPYCKIFSGSRQGKPTALDYSMMFLDLLYYFDEGDSLIDRYVGVPFSLAPNIRVSSFSDAKDAVIDAFLWLESCVSALLSKPEIIKRPAVFTLARKYVKGNTKNTKSINDASLCECASCRQRNKNEAYHIAHELPPYSYTLIKKYSEKSLQEMISKEPSREEAFTTLMRVCKSNRKNILLNAPAGTGKTLIAVAICEHNLSCGDFFIYLCDSPALKERLNERFSKLARTVLGCDYDFSTDNFFIVETYLSLALRLERDDRFRHRLLSEHVERVILDDFPELLPRNIIGTLNHLMEDKDCNSIVCVDGNQNTHLKGNKSSRRIEYLEGPGLYDGFMSKRYESDDADILRDITGSKLKTFLRKFSTMSLTLNIRNHPYLVEKMKETFDLYKDNEPPIHYYKPVAKRYKKILTADLCDLFKDIARFINEKETTDTLISRSIVLVDDYLLDNISNFIKLNNPFDLMFYKSLLDGATGHLNEKNRRDKTVVSQLLINNARTIHKVLPLSCCKGVEAETVIRLTATNPLLRNTKDLKNKYNYLAMTRAIVNYIEIDLDDIYSW